MKLRTLALIGLVCAVGALAVCFQNGLAPASASHVVSFLRRDIALASNALENLPLIRGLRNPAPTSDSAAGSGPYPATPLLRIELGQHSGDIKSMARDAASRFLVTGSWDKTVRVWELPNDVHPDLALVEVLRPPIARGFVGSVYAVAISPDGRLVAAGGWTGDNGKFAVIVFDRAAGDIIADLKVPQVVSSLAFSPKGTLIAAGLSGSAGLRVWRASSGKNWVQIATGDGYRDTIYGLSFAPDGRLAVASEDGGVRLYAADLKRLAWIDIGKELSVRATEDSDYGGVAAVSFGQKTMLKRIAFSPDGTKVAVGHLDALSVSVLDGQSLALLQTLKAPDWTEGNGEERAESLPAVAWSADGRYLFAAGGNADNASAGSILRWQANVDSAPVRLDARPDTTAVTDLAPYGKDGVLAAGLRPFIGGFAASDRPQFALGSAQYSMTGAFGNFRVSTKGDIVELAAPATPTADQSKSIIHIDLANFRVTRSAQSDASLALPLVRMSGPRFPIVRWTGLHPFILKAGGAKRPLALSEGEASDALAISPSGNWFALGTNFGIRTYGTDGTSRLSVNLPAQIRQIAITADDRFLIAAGGDGILRWFAIKDRAQSSVGLTEVIDVYVSPLDYRHFIVWGPRSGYYRASAGADNFIGWHINRGADSAALFYSASRFRKLYVRPALAHEVLRDGVEPPAPDPARLLSQLPPVVHILDVAPDEQGQVRVRYTLDSPSGQPVTDLHVLLDNDVLVDTAHSRGMVMAGGVHAMRIALPAAGSGTYLQVAATRDGYGDLARFPVPRGRSLRVVDDSVSAATAPPTGNLYALIIGVANYSDRAIAPAVYADLDAEAVYQVLAAQKSRKYQGVFATKLVGRDATKEHIVDKLREFAANATENDVIVLFIAGHGTTWNSARTGSGGGEYFFVPFDGDYTHKRIAYTFVPSEEIEGFIRRTLGRKFIFLDTCFSGDMGKVGMDDLLNIWGTGEHGAVVWSSSLGDQFSFPVVHAPPGFPSLVEHHGAFTGALLEAVYGKADAYVYAPTGQFITQHSLTTWFDSTVPLLSRQSQTPEVSGAGQSGPAQKFLAVIREQSHG